MQLSNNDFSFKKESDNEKNINVNLLNRKFNLIKLKNVYQEQINKMKIKVEQVKNSIKEFRNNNKNSNKNVKIDELKKKIEDVQNQNTELNSVYSVFRQPLYHFHQAQKRVLCLKYEGQAGHPPS